MEQPLSVVSIVALFRSRLRESCLSRPVDSSNPTQLDHSSRLKRVATLAYLSICVAKESQKSPSLNTPLCI